MAEKPKRKKVYIRTPKVTFQYTHLSRADQKYGRFSVSCTESEEVLGEVVEKLDQIIDDTFPAKVAKGKTFRRGYIRNEDGTITLKAGTKQAFSTVDAKGRPVLPGPLRIASGTKGKFNAEVVPQVDGDKPGITLYLTDVQVLSLKSYASGGFGDASDELDEDEEGFEASEDDVAEARRIAEERRAGAPAAGDAEAGDKDDAADGADSAEDF